MRRLMTEKNMKLISRIQKPTLEDIDGFKSIYILGLYSLYSISFILTLYWLALTLLANALLGVLF